MRLEKSGRGSLCWETTHLCRGDRGLGPETWGGSSMWKLRNVNSSQVSVVQRHPSWCLEGVTLHSSWELPVLLKEQYELWVPQGSAWQLGLTILSHMSKTAACFQPHTLIPPVDVHNQHGVLSGFAVQVWSVCALSLWREMKQELAFSKDHYTRPQTSSFQHAVSFTTSLTKK